MSADLSVTMQFDPEDGIADLETHLDQLKREADAAGLQVRPSRREERASGRDLR